MFEYFDTTAQMHRDKSDEGERGRERDKWREERVFAERNKYYKTRESSRQKLQRKGTFT